MTVQALEKVRKEITVEATQQTAFEVFTARMVEWWNPSHSIGGQGFVELVLEPHEGGRWFERDADGVECQWGKVLTWAPYDRVVLAWQIGADWAFDPDLVTEVEIRFVVAGPTTTRVELEHRNLERFGDAAVEVRSQLDAPEGWAGLLRRFAEALPSQA
jgi:hypothetical protein